MKKIPAYIFLIIILTGISGPIYSVQAAPCQYDDRGDVMNAPCDLPAGSTSTNRTGTTPAATTTYKLLAPLPCVPGSSAGCVNGELTSFDPAQNNLGAYLNTMIKIFIGICAVLAVVMIVIGGLEYMTSELPGNKEHGRERITGAVFGLLLALGAYALLFTINPDLLNSDVAIDKATIIVDLNADVPQAPVNGKFGTYSAGADWTAIAGPKASLPAWVTVYNSECTTVGQQNCTSTRGLSLGALAQIHNQCPDCGTLKITGGTEFWLHGGVTGSTTHQQNSTTVDLDPNPALNTYLSGGQALIRNKRYGPGGAYLYEGNHWHIGR